MFVLWDSMVSFICIVVFFFFKQKTAYEMRISDWSSDVCSSDLVGGCRDAAVRAQCVHPHRSRIERDTGDAQPGDGAGHLYRAFTIAGRGAGRLAGACDARGGATPSRTVLRAAEPKGHGGIEPASPRLLSDPPTRTEAGRGGKR